MYVENLPIEPIVLLVLLCIDSKQPGDLAT
jgi:hypothetical protein